MNAFSFRFFSYCTLVLTILSLNILSLNIDAQAAPKKEGSAHLVEMTQVTEQELSPQQVFSATFKARQVWRAFTRESGHITHLPFYEGDTVASGVRVLALDTRRLQAELARAEALEKQADADVQRLKELGGQRLVAEEQLQQARTRLTVARIERQLLQIRLDDMQLHTPFAGIVSARLAEPGDAVSSNTHILSIFAPDSLIVESKIPEHTLAALTVGTLAQVRIDAIGEQNWSGKVQRLFPTLDSDTHQGTVDIVLDSLPPTARPGQFCRVTFSVLQRKVTAIPYSALQRDREGEFVFMLDAAQRVMRVAVESGAHLPQHVEIRQGLRPGDNVVNKGFLKLKQGMAVEVVKTHY
jgi:RND family efflux transporter MFP subunit